MKKQRLTAGEFMAQLEADPEYQARRARLDEEHEKRVAELERAMAPLIEDLVHAGIEESMAWNIASFPGTYDHVLPLLLEHLHRPYPTHGLFYIVRAMQVPAAAFAWDELYALYSQKQSNFFDQGLADTLAYIGRKDRISEIVAIVRNPEFGLSRVLFLRVLGRTKDPRGLATILELQEDPDLHFEISHILRQKERYRLKREQAKAQSNTS